MTKTAFQVEQEAKKSAKAAKAAAAKQEKERAQQDKVIQEFNEKQAAASSASDAVGQLKAWCSKPPYLDLTTEYKVSKSLHHTSTSFTHIMVDYFCTEKHLCGSDHSHYAAD